MPEPLIPVVPVSDMFGKAQHGSAMDYLWIPLLVAAAALVAWKSPKETHGPIGCVGRVHADLQARREREEKERADRLENR